MGPLHILAMVASAALVVAGLVIYRRGSRRTEPQAGSLRRLGRLMILVGAGLTLLTVVLRFSDSPYCRALRKLEQESLAEIRLDDRPIDDPVAVAAVVKALRRTSSHTPKPPGHADEVLLTLVPVNGPRQVIGLAESLGAEGLVLVFYDDEAGSSVPAAYGFNKTLSKALLQAGIVLPAMRLRQQLDVLRSGPSAVVTVGRKNISNASQVGSILHSLQTATQLHVRDPRQFQESVEIALTQSSGQMLRIRAARMATGEGAGFWAMWRCPNGQEISYGHGLSYTLPDALDEAGVPLPSRRE